MRRPRFTIRSLLGVVLFIAVAVAALRASTDAWDGGLFGSALLILLTAVLLTVHRTDHKRAFWLGFALFGWAYLVASLIPMIESRLPTTKGLAHLDSKVPGREKTLTVRPAWANAALANTTGPNTVRAVAFSPQGNTLSTSSQGTVRVWDTWSGKLLAGPGGISENFIRIGHSLLALVVAFLGGLLSRYLYAGGRVQREGMVPTSPSSPSPSDGS